MTEEIKEPIITVATDNTLVLSAATFAMLGEPQGIRLLYNQDQHILGIGCDGKIPIWRSPDGCCINGQGFFRHHGIIITETTSYTAMKWPRVTEEGVPVPLGGHALFIDISDLVAESDAFRDLFLEQPAIQKNGKIG